jgi:Fe-S-cluster containining protein
MSRPDAPNAAYGSPERLHFPDEARQPWLGLLLEAYYITDQGVARAIAKNERKGRRLACARGCANCCKSHKDIPVYPLELVGIAWYATEKVTGEVRAKLQRQLAEGPEHGGCPFLVDEVCAIHPLRPMACRQFNVFGESCAVGEDAYHTRRKDVMTPIKQYADDAFFVMLPFYGVSDEGERRDVIRLGSIHKMARVLREQSWATLADKMRRFDAAPES